MLSLSELSVTLMFCYHDMAWSLALMFCYQDLSCFLHTVNLLGDGFQAKMLLPESKYMELHPDKRATC